MARTDHRAAHAHAAVANLPAYIELFAETIVEELDFRLEAQNMLDVAAVLAVPASAAVIVPARTPSSSPAGCS